MVFMPETFGKYVLLKRIAVGGMAEVFRAKAFGAEGFEKLVAIKRMLPHLSSDEQFVGMFINEAKITASLNHVNIAQIYDFGCIEKLYFLSMEFVFGKDLADLIRMLRNHGLAAPVEFACHVMIETLNGLDYAHRKVDSFGEPLNLIHRDTSPHNLIISYEGEVKIVDFGIAKAKSTTIHTTGGVLKGKYSYMSPEQAHGISLDHRTDIFSLGICFYELLTLTKMFQGSSDLSVLEKVRETEFIPPRELNDSIPEELDDLLIKALEKNPEDRWSSAAEWRDELESFMFRSNLHYSTSWLAGFMSEIFREQIEQEASDLAEEAEVAEKLRTNARRAARMDAIREVFVEEKDLADELEPAFHDTARAARPLGQLRAERAAASARLSDADRFEDLEEVSEEDVVEDVSELPSMGSLDDDSMPTVELSRPVRAGEPNRIPARRPPIREAGVAARPGADVDEAEIDTLDESHPPPPPLEMEEEYTEADFSMSGITGEAALMPSDFGDDLDTLKKRRARPAAARKAVMMEESTARSTGKPFPVAAAALILLAALGVGGAVAIWPDLVGSDPETGAADAGLASAIPGGGRIEPASRPDAGHPSAIAEPLRPDRDRTAADAWLAGTGGDPGGDPGGDVFLAAAEPGLDTGGDPVAEHIAVSTGADTETVKPPGRKKRRRYRRRHTTSCPSRGYGSVDVGVSGGWAFVHIDGHKVRATPMLNYRLKAGRHKIELRDGSDKLVRRWNICLKNGIKVKLLHQ